MARYTWCGIWKLLAQSQTYELSLFIGGKRTYAIKQRDAGHDSDGVEQVHRSQALTS